jgi:hypothetical protein
MKTPPVPSEFIARIRMLIHYAGTIRWQTVAVAVGSLVVILLWPRSDRCHLKTAAPPGTNRDEGLVARTARWAINGMMAAWRWDHERLRT